jgi:Uma2 family endonuclease
MVALPKTSEIMTEAEYLEFEVASQLKHEFVNGRVVPLIGTSPDQVLGEVVAMTVASEAHNLINVNLITTLRNQLRGRPCKVYPSDMRVKVVAPRLYTYPDISVVCGDVQFSDDPLDTLLNPTLIIEILSPSTERYDRGRKFQDYRELASLREYVLVAQDGPIIERYFRQDDGVWQLTDARGLDASLELVSIDCALKLAEVYEQVTFTESSGEAS